jgi:hypothetical protein
MGAGVRSFIMGAGVQSWRLLEAVGLERRAKPVMSFDEYCRKHAQELVEAPE